MKDGQQVKIRLASIDCPEKGQPYGQAARKFTVNMVAGKVVKVWQTDTDRYGGIFGFVFVGDKNLNKELLASGLAWHYKQYSRDPQLAKLEFQARSKKIGLWSEPDPVPPWSGDGKRDLVRKNLSSVVEFLVLLSIEEVQYENNHKDSHLLGSLGISRCVNSYPNCCPNAHLCALSKASVV